MIKIHTNPNLPRLQVGQHLKVWNEGKHVGIVNITKVDSEGKFAEAEADLFEGYSAPSEVEISIEKPKDTTKPYEIEYYVGI